MNTWFRSILAGFTLHKLALAYLGLTVLLLSGAAATFAAPKAKSKTMLSPKQNKTRAIKKASAQNPAQHPAPAFSAKAVSREDLATRPAPSSATPSSSGTIQRPSIYNEQSLSDNTWSADVFRTQEHKIALLSTIGLLQFRLKDHSLLDDQINVITPLQLLTIPLGEHRKLWLGLQYFESHMQFEVEQAGFNTRSKSYTIVAQYGAQLSKHWAWTSGIKYGITNSYGGVQYFKTDIMPIGLETDDHTITHDLGFNLGVSYRLIHPGLIFSLTVSPPDFALQSKKTFSSTWGEDRTEKVRATDAASLDLGLRLESMHGIFSVNYSYNFPHKKLDFTDDDYMEDATPVAQHLSGQQEFGVKTEIYLSALRLVPSFSYQTPQKIKDPPYGNEKEKTTTWSLSLVFDQFPTHPAISLLYNHQQDYSTIYLGYSSTFAIK